MMAMSTNQPSNGCGCGGNCKPKRSYLNGPIDTVFNQGEPIATIGITISNQDLMKLAGGMFLATLLANFLTK